MSLCPSGEGLRTHFLLRPTRGPACRLRSLPSRYFPWFGLPSAHSSVTRSIDFGKGTPERVLKLVGGRTYTGDATAEFRRSDKPFVFLFGV